MSSLLKLSHRETIVAAVIMLGGLTLLCVLPAGGIAGQGRERIVVVKDCFDPPVKIKAVRVKGRQIKTDEKILGDDDWLGGLAVSITNDTDKDILSINVGVTFLRPEGQEKEAPLSYDLEHGADPFWLDPNVEYRADKAAIPPGGKVDIIFPVDDLASIKSMLRELGYLSSHKGVEVHIRSLSFSDGTGWHTGTYLRRDPDPSSWKLFKGWREIEKPRGSAVSGAAKFFCVQVSGL